MDKFAKPGEFCPNEACRDYGKLQNEQEQRNLQKFGKTPRGVQRYRCISCGRTFTETTGTLFFRKHAAEKDILATLVLLAEGSRISSLSRAKGFKEDTILSWLRDAARHAKQIEEVLMTEYKVKRAQLDAMWSFVGNKGEKKLPGDG
jgi:transposase-like protein